ncbi:MAG: ATP-binding protein [Gemmatimonadaceae bacterium]
MTLKLSHDTAVQDSSERPRNPLLFPQDMLQHMPGVVVVGRPLWQRLSSAALVWGLAFGLTMLFAPQIQRSIFIFLWVAILFAAWYSGFVIAFLCSIASVLAIHYFFVQPVHTFAVPRLSDFLMLLVFVIVASFVSALTNQVAADQRATRARANELGRLNEQLVQQQRELAARGDAAQSLMREVESANAGLAVVNAALEESEQRWQTLADIAPVFIWTTDARGRCTWVSRPWLDFTGRTLDQELGAGWFAGIHPDDEPHCREIFTRALAERTPFTMEYRLRRNDQVYRWITNRGVPRTSDESSFIGFIGSCIDLSERREAEEWSRALQALGASLTSATSAIEVAESASRDAALVVGAVGCTLALVASDGERLEVVMRPRGAADASPPVVLYHHLPDRAPEWEAVRSGSPVVIGDMELWSLEHPDIALVAADACEALVAMPLKLEGQSAGALSFAFPRTRAFDADDLTFLDSVAHLCAQAIDRVRLFEGEQRARREADAANRAKTDFLAQLSHELRTPLNAVGGYADLIELEIHGPITEAQRTALGRLKRAQQELLTHIDELLTFARIDRAQPSYAFAPVRAAAVFREVESLVSPQAGGKGIELVIATVEPTLSGWGDRDRVRQILLNLATNAIKYTPNGGRVELRARGRTVDTGEAFVDFDVCDTGRGIPEDKLEAIFDPFVQLSQRPFEPREGVGLGLAISRRLAADMDGKLTVTSEVGVGSTFRLTLRGLPA